LDALERLLDGGWRIAIVSGRPAVEARRLVPLRRVAVFGSHGIEREGAPPASRALRAIALRAARLARQARAAFRDFDGVDVERKPYGCAFHHRAVEATSRTRFRRRLVAWLAERDTRGFELLDGKRVVELRPAGLGKGVVARRWAAARAARRGDHSLVAIGDDRSDEDIFAAIVGRGLAVSVGPSRNATIAERRLPGTAAVVRLLAALAATGELERRHERR
jgi:trehalose 6-phosphate synthase/phosphatase